MPYNVTIDDLSPLITYKGQWTDAYKTPNDPYVDRYWGESFHSSLTDGSQMSITFNGTAIYIFGAKRGNHGHYIVTVDNEQAQRFDGFAPQQSDGTDGVYQVAIFAQTGLSNGLHTVVLTNDGGADADRPYVDVDFITWTSNDPTPRSNNTVDDGAFTYTSPGADWFTSSQYVGDYYGKTEHATNVGGATASLTFEGAGFYLYGGTLNDHGTYNVQVDDHAPVGLNGTTKDYHPRQLLYYADGLGYGKHKVTVTNTQSGAYLDIDYIDIIQSSSSEASQSNPDGKALTPIIAGTVCGVVIGLAWIIAAVWWFMKRRKRRNEGADLLNPEAKPYVPPAGYGPASGGPGWSDSGTQANSMARDQPWANDPAYMGYAHSNSQSGTGTYPMSMYPPSSVSGSQGPGSSSGGGSAYGGAGGTGHTRPSTQHQPLSGLTQASESDVRVNEMVPPPNVKGRPVTAPSTGTRGNMTDDELRESRMRVPERPQDWGPVTESENEFSGTLPPDYNQATEPFRPLRSGVA
ncbi:transmembrane protein [Ceratobasidium sp. AG-Ba]|nr:transmembrane protein [Ceratobasidium sp. AG-Ba]QRW11473.1 transmembrane protein [Ceratobasidium sp. AG-Ba]